MPDLKIYKICANGLLHYIVHLQGYSICNLLYFLKKNGVVEPRLVSNAILQHDRFESISEHFFYEGFKDYIRGSRYYYKMTLQYIGLLVS